MTEHDWLTSTRVYDLTHHNSSRDARKRRLLGCACARRVLHFMTDTRLVQAVDAAEQYADGEIDWAAMKQVRQSVAACRRDMQARKCQEFEWDASLAAEVVTAKDTVSAVHAIESAQHAATAAARPKWDAAACASEQREQLILAHDIFGNPFHPVAFLPEWRIPDAVGIAVACYQSRDFGNLPILADALEEAGCDDPGILAHCRGSGPHVRGCWVVDLVLGKS